MEAQESWTESRTPLLIAVGVVVLIGIGLCFLRPQGLSLDGQGFQQVNGRIAEVRIVPVFASGADGLGSPAVIYYRAEARAIFEWNGQHYDEWLPASHDTDSRHDLEVWVSKTKDDPAVIYVTRDGRAGVVHLKAKF